MKKNITVILFMLFAVIGLRAQDVVYSQFYANPLYLNPAMAGSKISQRVTLNYRNQWPSVRKGYVSYCATWDEQIDKLSGALGVMVTSDAAGQGVYNKFSASGIYSYRLQATRNITLNAALQAGYARYRLDFESLTFGDQIQDVYTGTTIPTSEKLPTRQNIGNVDFSAGLLASYKGSVYIGVAANHLSRPDLSFYEADTNRLDMRLTIHSGVLLDFDQGWDGVDARNFSISPNFIYVQQGQFRQLNLGMYVNLYPMVLGLWMRHNFENPDGMIAQFGFQQPNYKIGYSFDYTLSRLTMKTAGAHEITITFLFREHIAADRYHKMRGPDF
jgi:type IX secretion system PorP/SprF family membrane protein